MSKLHLNGEQKDETALLMVSFVDCLQRMDALLLEIRHVQTDIIAFLHLPTLYKPLREEEKHLWGLGWGELFQRTEKEPIKRAVEAWMPHFPDPLLWTADTVVEGDWTSLVQCWVQGSWNREQKRFYHNLRTIQRLKKHIFHDKLYLCRFVYQLLQGLTEPNDRAGRVLTDIRPGQYNMVNFFLLRRAAMARLQDYVQRVGDHQAQLKKYRDRSIPLLADQCLEMRRLMLDVMQTLALSEPVYSPAHPTACLIVNGGAEANSRIFHVQHDWANTAGEETAPPTTHYLKSSFWMADRPDLHSVMAHEVAHTVLREWLGEFNLLTSLPRNSSWICLAHDLHYCLDLYRPSAETVLHPVLHLHKILADLLAGTTQGTSYLFALFQELNGVNLEELFQSPLDRYDMTKIFHLQGAGGRLDQMREWYFRLRILCAWLKAMNKSQQTPLDDRLIHGIETLLGRWLDALDLLAPENEKSGYFWCSLTDRLCAIVSSSRAISEARRWKWEKNKGLSNKFAPLPSGMVSLLRNSFIERKRNLWQGVFGQKGNDFWQSVYALPMKDADPTHLATHLPDSLFRHGHEFPWQYGFLRSMEYVHEFLFYSQQEKAGERGDAFFLNTQGNSSFGREFYALARDSRGEAQGYFPFLLPYFQSMSLSAAVATAVLNPLYQWTRMELSGGNDPLNREPTNNSIDVPTILRYQHWEHPLFKQQMARHVKKRWQDVLGHSLPNVTYTVLLGQQDLLSFHPTRPPDFAPLPQFPLGQASFSDADHFPIFSTTRHLGLPVWFRPGQISDAFQQSGRFPLALISLRLYRPECRFEFLHRLLKGITTESITKNSNPQQLSELSGWFDIANDMVFMMEGWGDFLILFYGKPDRLGDLFHIQQVLATDVLVDHSALLLTPDCIIAAARVDTEEPAYELRSRLRLLGSDPLPSFLPKTHPAFHVTAYHGQNRMDYDLQWTFKKGATQEERAQIWNSWMDGLGQTLVDRVKTTIVKKA